MICKQWVLGMRTCSSPDRSFSGWDATLSGRFGGSSVSVAVRGFGGTILGMPVDPELLEILRCPADKGPLHHLVDEAALYNPRLRRRYAIPDGIPIMTIDQARTVDDAEHDRIMARLSASGISVR